MKKLIFWLLTTLCIATHLQINGMEKQALAHIPINLRKLLPQTPFLKCMWECTSIKQFEKVLTQYPEFMNKFLTEDVDNVTRYKTFFKDIFKDTYLLSDEKVLLIAAQIGHLELFKHYFNLETSPLNTEENAGSYQSLQDMLEAVRDDQGNTVAHRAAHHRHAQIWNYLIRDLDLDLYGSQELYAAIETNDIQKVQEILEISRNHVNGLNNNTGHQPYDYVSADQHVTDGLPTPLIHAIQHFACNEILETLLQQGADITMTHKVDDMNILHLCILHKNWLALRFFVKKCAPSKLKFSTLKVNDSAFNYFHKKNPSNLLTTKNKNGETPLFLMIKCCEEITPSEESKHTYFKNLLTYIKKNYELDIKTGMTPTGITIAEYLEKNPENCTGNNDFKTVTISPIPNIIVKIENKFWSLFKPLGRLIDKYWYR